MIPEARARKLLSLVIIVVNLDIKSRIVLKYLRKSENNMHRCRNMDMDMDLDPTETPWTLAATTPVPAASKISMKLSVSNVVKMDILRTDVQKDIWHF